MSVAARGVHCIVGARAMVALPQRAGARRNGFLDRMSSHHTLPGGASRPHVPPVPHRRARPRLPRLARRLAALALAAAAGHAWAAGRYALVIGNAAYPQPLVNPVNDARALGDRLRQLGFEVDLEQDLDAARLRQALRAFARRGRGAEVALVYYAGHGAQANDSSYLLPIGAEVGHPSARSIEDQGVPLDEALGELQRADARSSVMILDACREIYLRGGAPAGQVANQGFAAAPAPRGLVIAYSTAPGARARDYWSPEVRNSPYTAALVEVLGERGLNLGDVFARVSERVALLTHDTQRPHVSFGETSVRLVLNDGRAWPAGAPGSAARLAQGSASGDAPAPAGRAATVPAATWAAAQGGGRPAGPPGPPGPPSGRSAALTAAGADKAGADKAGASGAGAAGRWPGYVLQDLNYEIRQLVAQRPFPRQALERRARGGDVVAQTALGRGLPQDGAPGAQARRWAEKAAAKGFPPAQTDLAERLILAGDAASLARAAPLLDAAVAAGYAPAHAYQADLALRRDGDSAAAARHLLQAMGATMRDVTEATSAYQRDIQVRAASAPAAPR